MSQADAAKALQQRNEWMVDRGGEVACVWNCSGGGTANCLRYARRLKRPITNLFDNYQRDWESELRLV